jgi:hypothetical protein
MHTMRMVAAVVLATMVGCAGSTPTTTTKTSSSPKGTSSARPKLVPATGNTPAPDVTVAPLRDGHALAVKDVKPAAVNATKNGSNVTYEPDPPDVQVSLAVPDTSLGSRLASLKISYDAGAGAAKIADQTWPLAPKSVNPGDVTVVQVPIGNAVLKPLITGANPPPVIVTTVRFIDDRGLPIMGVDGQELTASVNVMVQ